MMEVFRNYVARRNGPDCKISLCNIYSVRLPTESFGLYSNAQTTGNKETKEPSFECSSAQDLKSAQFLVVGSCH